MDPQRRGQRMGAAIRRALSVAGWCAAAVLVMAALRAVPRADGLQPGVAYWGAASPVALQTSVPLSPLAQAVRRVSPAVVAIRIPGDDDGMLPPAGVGWDAPAVVGEDRWACGVVVSRLGLVVTSAHAVRGSTQVSVVLWDKRDLPAKVLGVDPATDLALLRVPARNLQAATLSKDASARVGTRVVAIGNSLGFGPSATFGIMSATGRRVYLRDRGRIIGGLLQTDAAANPGSSGGPLCNTRGEVVAVLVAADPDGQGIAFGVPAATVRRVAMQIARRGTVPRPWLGVRYHQLATSPARYGAEGTRRLVVHGVALRSPAEAAGLRPGDVLVSANGRPIRRREDLQAALADAGVGGEVVLRVLRGGEVLSVRMVARQMPV